MSDLPTPITRKEQFLNSIARGNTSDLPTPITREEEYLDAIAKSGGGGGEGDMKKSVYDSDLTVANAGGIGAFVGDAVSGKVDKVEGKGLSTNDYSDTEKGKVAANAEAIGAIVNVTGSCNIWATAQTQTVSEVTFTYNADGSVTATGNEPATYRSIVVASGYLLKAGTYKLSKGVYDKQEFYLYISNDDNSGSDVATCNVEDVEFTLSVDTHVTMSVVCSPWGGSFNNTIYPMLYDARLNPTGYVPYAMTNRELTERVSWKYIDSATGNTSISLPSDYNEIIIEVFIRGDRTDGFVFNLCKEQLSSRAKVFKSSYYATPDYFFACQVSVTLSAVELTVAINASGDVAATSYTNVYSR